MGEARRQYNTFKMADADAIKKICDIYDWDGKGQLDMFYLMDVVYAAGFNVTKKICVGLGQQEEEGKKFVSFDDVVGLVNTAIKTPECSGTYHDYVELCKLYDKNENGTMNLADEIPKEDTMALLAELADPEDEDGMFPYKPFLDRLTSKSFHQPIFGSIIRQHHNVTASPRRSPSSS